MPRIAYAFSLMTLYKCRYLLHGYVIARLQCSFGSVEQLAYIRIFHFVVVAQVEHDTLHIGQRSDSLLQQSMRLIAVKIVVSHESAGYCHVAFIAKRGYILLASDEVKRLIHSDTIQPCGYF